LTEGADRVGRLVRGYPSALVARIGGDEFACVVEHQMGSDLPIRLAKQMVDRLAKPFAVQGAMVTIGASIGIAVCAEGLADADELLRSADFAMYRAKRDGRSTFRSFEPSMQAEVVKRAALESDLRAALGNGEVIPFYQPITHLPDGELAGFEALARWKHPVLGMLEPDQFISIAEDAGLIDELTFVLLRQACRDAKSWPVAMTLSINLSPIQLKNRWLAARLLQIVTEGGLAPSRLTVEITESGLVSDFEAAQHIITSLKNAGVQVALDDFGTGFSTLSHLRQLNIDRIKIDRSFIHDILEPDTARMIRAIIALGMNLGIAVTAEGIETQAGMDLLAKFGCDLGQGFLTGPPVSAADISRQYFTPAAPPLSVPRATGAA
jgi:predicted signal transduction protein with EAL and GGDEF domain